jgi:cytochrome P450 family 135
VHRRADVYPQPAVWRPERWLGELGPTPDDAAWIPFGGGVRRCLGASFALMELAEVLRALTAAADLEPAAAADGRARGERMRRRGVTLQPGAGARVVLR